MLSRRKLFSFLAAPLLIPLIAMRRRRCCEDRAVIRLPLGESHELQLEVFHSDGEPAGMDVDYIVVCHSLIDDRFELSAHIKLLAGAEIKIGRFVEHDLGSNRTLKGFANGDTSN